MTGSVGAAPSSLPAQAARRRWLWCLGLVVACIWFGSLDARHLLRSDEGRYAEIAREMVASGDWVTIRYNGLKYFEKPPLHLWATALAFEAFGVGEWQARLWVALCGAGGLLVTVLAARRWFGARVAGLSGLALLAAPSWNVGGHFNSLDMGVSAALAVVLAGVLLAQHPRTSPAGRRGWMGLAWAAMGLAVLSKGLIGIVLPGLVLVVYTVVARDLSLWRRLHIFSGAVLMLAIAAPWFVLVSLRNPEFPQFFFIHEHFQRYTSGVHQRGAPVWYFVPQLIAGFLPWVGLAWRAGLRVQEDVRAPGFRPVLLLALWALAILAFFSFSGSKLPGYILPVFPALAVLAALALERIEARAWQRQLAALAALALAGLLGCAWLGSAAGPTDDAPLQAYAPWLAGACALLLAGLLRAGWLARRGRLDASVACHALAFFLATTLGLLGHETLGRGISGIDLVPAVQAELRPGMPIYAVRLLDHTLPFYLRHTMVMVEAPDELEFGTLQEPQKWLPTLAAFRQTWVAGPPALALMAPETHEALRGENLPLRVLARDARRVIVANFESGPGPARGPGPATPTSGASP